MARVKWQVASRRRRKRLLAKAKGYRGARRTHISSVRETVMRAMAYATRDRKVKKRSFRSLWVMRVNAAARARGLPYGQLMAALRRANILLNRQQLSELAIHAPGTFDRVASTALGREVGGTSKAPANVGAMAPA